MPTQCCQEKEEQHSRALEANRTFGDDDEWITRGKTLRQLWETDNMRKHIFGLATWACPRQECRILIAFKAENIPDICRHTPVSLEQDWRLCIVEPFESPVLLLGRTKPSQTDQIHVSGVSALELVSLHFFEHSFTHCNQHISLQALFRHLLSVFGFPFTDSASLDTSQHIWEAKDEEHRKKLEDLMQNDGLFRFPFFSPWSEPLSGNSPRLLWPLWCLLFEISAASVVKCGKEMRCCDGT